MIRAGLAEQVETVLGHLRLQRTVGILAPVGHELVEADGIDHDAGQNMRADFRAFFDHDHGEVRG